MGDSRRPPGSRGRARARSRRNQAGRDSKATKPWTWSQSPLTATLREARTAPQSAERPKLRPTIDNMAFANKCRKTAKIALSDWHLRGRSGLLQRSRKGALGFGGELSLVLA